MYKVRWYRPYINATCTVQVDEGNGWISYKRSKLYVPDKDAVSEGYLTFSNCLEHGYINQPIYSNNINLL